MVLGHEKQRQFLQKIHNRKCFSHAYLFSGEEKLGKKTVALEWLSRLIGPLHNHPDFIFLAADKKEIQIGQIRDMISRLSLKPSLASLKAALIDDSHLMNKEAQTALLKTLEEPRGRTLLILISHQPESLLPTIISRLEEIKFYRFSDKEIKKIISKKNLPDKITENICRFVRGRPGLAFDLINDVKKAENIETRTKELIQIAQMPFYFRFHYVKKISDDPAAVKDILDIWLDCLRKDLLDRFCSKSSASLFLAGYPAKRLAETIKLIEETKLLIRQTNINTKLALERLIMEI